MLSIKRLSKKFGRQSLSEVKPAPPSSTVDHTVQLSPPINRALAHPPSLPPTTYSSDSDSDEDWTTAASVQSVKYRKHVNNQLSIERVSSAEKRKHRQYKYSTGSSSSACSSDDEVKEAFEDRSHQRHSCLSSTQSWSSSQKGHPLCSNRPLKVVPLGHRKPKYFAQMTVDHSERPRLDFNKMQHSKRLVVVRRPLVLRNNSKVHSIQRPPSLEVSLDISAHSFQPVLTQT